MVFIRRLFRASYVKMMVVRNLLGQKKVSDPESESLLSHTSHTEHHMSNPRVISDIILVQNPSPYPPFYFPLLSTKPAEMSPEIPHPAYS